MTVADIQFEPVKHRYSDAQGSIPSVTSVLSPLDVWGDKEGSFINPEVLEAARRFGSHVHLAVDLYNKNELGIASLDPALAPYLTAWIRFLDQSGMVITHSEHLVYNKQYRYAGRVDSLGILKGQTWVVDVKSGMVPWTVGFQTAAYQEACQERPKRRMCVQLKGTGDFKIFEQKDPRDFQLFISALNLHRFRRGKNANVE